MGKRGRSKRETSTEQPRIKRGRPAKAGIDALKTEQLDEDPEAASKRSGSKARTSRSSRTKGAQSQISVDDKQDDIVDSFGDQSDSEEVDGDKESKAKTKGGENTVTRGRGRKKLPGGNKAGEHGDEVDSVIVSSSSISQPEMSVAKKRGRGRGRAKQQKEVEAKIQDEKTASAPDHSSSINSSVKIEPNSCNVETMDDSSDSDDFEDVPETKYVVNMKRESVPPSSEGTSCAANIVDLVTETKTEDLSDSDGFEDVPDPSTTPCAPESSRSNSTSENLKTNSEKSLKTKTKHSKPDKQTKDSKKGSGAAKKTDSHSKPRKQSKRKKDKEEKGGGRSPKKRKPADPSPGPGISRQSSQLELIDVRAMLMQMEGGGAQPSTSGVKHVKRDHSAPPFSSDSEGSDWEEVEDLEESNQTQASKSTDPIVISVDAPEGLIKKRKRKQFDWQAHLLRQMKRYQKETQISMHQVHLLCLLSFGMQQNVVCNDSAMKSIAMSVVPMDLLKRLWNKVDMGTLKAVVSWFQTDFPIESFNTQSALMTRSKLEQLFSSHKAHNTEQLAVMLVLILRAVGVECRLLFSLQPLPLKTSQALDLASKASSKKTSKKQGDITEEKTAGKEGNSLKSDSKPAKKAQTSKMPQKLAENSKDISSAKNTTKSKHKDSREKSDHGNIPTPSHGKKSSKDKPTKKAKESTQTIPPPSKSDSRTASNKRALRAKKPSKTKQKKAADEDEESSDNLDSGDEYAPSDSDDSSNYSEEEKPVSKGRRVSKGKATSKTKPKSRPSVESSDEEFEDSKVSYRSPSEQRQKFKAKKNRQILSDSSETSLTELSRPKGCDMWVEVFLPIEDKWICIDCTSGNMNKPHDIESRATLPVHYVLAFAPDGSVKDVTARYASQWMSITRKLRVEQEWWEETLLPYKCRDCHSNRRDDYFIKEQLLNKPLPTSIGEYKNHPLYALSRHLLKYEAIYPDTAVPLGYIKDEPVYARECVHVLHSRENWLKEGRLVRIGESPYKVVKARKKWSQRNDNPENQECELFGHWQTEIYIPPPAYNGKVPKNEYGNVELFKPWMLPGGTVHVQVPGLQRIARKLNLDIAPAMVGWDHHGGWPHPVLDGWIVCEEHKDILLAAWEEDQEIQQQREQEKREKRALGNWKLLVRGLLIKQRLKKKFDQKDDLVELVQQAAEDTSDSEEEKEKQKTKGKAGTGKKGTKGKKTKVKEEDSSEEVATDAHHAWPNRKMTFK